jgi:diamine N-acetyltransferase
MKAINGQIIRLCPATLADRRRIFEWLALSDLTAKMMGPPDFPDNPVPTWEEFLDDYLPHFFDDENPYIGRSYVIEARGEAVGQINYNDIDRSTGTVELDIWLAGSQHTHKGYGSDAILTLCRFLNENLDCNAFILAPSVLNGEAVAAYRKCGFEPIDWVPEGFVPDYGDTVIMMKRM